MELDKFIEKWSYVAGQRAGYMSGSKYNAILRVLKETSIREKVSEKSGPRLLQLDLSGNQKPLKTNRLDDEDLEILLEALNELDNSTSVVLGLRYNSITNAGMDCLCKYMEKSMCPLLDLDLGYNDLTEEGATELAQSFHHNISVQTLSLRGNKISRQGGLQVASMLQVNQTLRSLDIAETDASTDVVIAMATVLHGNRYIECMDISSPLLHSRGEETTVHLAEMLRINSTLTTLYLSKHRMTDSGLFVLCKNLQENTTLQYLDLSCNKISRDGARMISDLLIRNPPMKILDLSCNRIEDEGAEYLGKAINSSNLTLRKLYIGYNSISDSGLASFANAIERNFTLTHLAVWGNETGIEASKAFQRLLKSGRMNQNEVDVQPYVVDGTVYLAKMDSPPAT